MRTIVSWIFTIPYVPLFWGILCALHPLQMIALVFGYRAHKTVLDLMNLCLITNFKTAGTRTTVDFRYTPPEHEPLIFVSNHQSMYDIPYIIWIMRRYHPKFISKRELGKWIPSISFALRNMGSVLIDRKDQGGAIGAIEAFARTMYEKKFAAVIFPEGTRARDGKVKNFKSAGLGALLKNMPNAKIVPIAIDGSWELVRYYLFPIPFGCRVTFTVLPPVETANRTGKEVALACEKAIREALSQPIRPDRP